MLSLALQTYIYYGVEIPPKFLQDPFFYKKENYTVSSDLLYDYRWFTVVEEDLGYSFSYIIRNDGAEIFETRWTILRFQKWFIINVSWFQPDKLKNKRLRKSQIFNKLVVSRQHSQEHARSVRSWARISTLAREQTLKSLHKHPTYVF